MLDRDASLQLLINLDLPLVRMRSAKVPPKVEGAGKWRRVPWEKWADITRVDRSVHDFRDCSVAIQTGHPMADGRRLYILDIDVKHPRGADTFAWLKETYGTEWTTGTSSNTESGGKHFWFASAKEYPVIVGLLDGIDFLGIGTISFEPPSQFWEGNTAREPYTWQVLPPSTPQQIPELPEWLDIMLGVKKLAASAKREGWEASDAKLSSDICTQASLDFIESCLKHYTPQGGLVYWEWLKLGMAIHESTSEHLRDAACDVFDAWGARVAKEFKGEYDSQKTRVSWDSFGNRTAARVGFGTLVRTLAEDAGVQHYTKEQVNKLCEIEFSEPQAKDSLDSLLAELSEPECTSLETKESADKKASDKKVKKQVEAKLTVEDNVIKYLELEPLLMATSGALDNPTLRRNIATGGIEVTDSRGETQQMTDALQAFLVLKARDFGMRVKVMPLTKEKDVLRAIDILAERGKYHPIKEYVGHAMEKYRREKFVYEITSGNIEPDHYRKQLFAKLDFEDKAEQAWFEKAFSYWLQGAVCRVIYGYTNPMLILQGTQGRGKSTLAKALCRGIGTHYYYAGTISTQDKDHKLKLANLLIWEADELASTTKGDIDKLKSFLTLSYVNERLPYARHATTSPVVTSFIGTTNDSFYLRDTTGSRRMIVTQFNPRNWQELVRFLWSNEFDPDLLWGEVVAEICDLNITIPAMPDEMIDESQKRAEEVREISDIEDLLLDYYEAGKPNDAVTRKEVRALLQDQLRASKWATSANEVFRRMSKHFHCGAVRKNGILERAWFGVRSKIDSKNMFTAEGEK